ncbi:hypothetical protein FK216_09740 [Moraxellaceae bacterium AER2_44_116]|nr:hypothetical protein [Moraxellaceae bacterium]TQC97168.1 hypothetical protein FK216_09740 [Moraxellaceae bacterium AER2_44_116]
MAVFNGDGSNNGNNLLVGGIEDDALNGLEGNDTLEGGTGSDTLDGGLGRDELYGQEGNDTYIINELDDIVVELIDEGNDVIKASVSYTLLNNVENLVLMGSGAIQGIGNELSNHILGGEADNSLVGGLGYDAIDGDIGSDVLYGNEDNDTLTGGLGNDSLFGGSGDDSLNGDEGNDVLLGEEGSDYLRGGLSEDTLDGGVGQDNLDGGEGDDVLYAGVTNVVLNADPSQISYQIIAQDSQGDAFSGGAGSDTIIAGDSNDVISGGDGANVVFANGGNDTITGGVSNYVDGGDGNDDIRLGSSAIVKGGAGDDYIQADGNINNIDGGSGNDWIVASGVLTGGAGDDLFRVDLTPPTLYGPYEITDFVMGGNEDSIDNYRILQELRHNAGFDASNIDAWLRAVQSGADTLIQVDKTGPQDGSSFQTVVILKNTLATQITGADFGHWITLGGGAPAADINQTVSAELLDRTGTYMGKDGNDTLIGEVGSINWIDGGLGNDSLVGQDSSDVLFGDFGNDDLHGNGDGDFIAGGSGNDTIYGGDGDDRYGGVTYKGTSYSNGLLGEEGDDYIDGGDGKDRLDGGSGNDTLKGGMDDDTLYGGSGTDQLYGEAGDDYLSTSGIYDGNDSLYGGSGKDDLNADGNNNLLEGGEDIDSLAVNGSQSTLMGGLGADSLTVNGDNNLLDGGEGDSHFDVYGNANTVVGGDGTDVISLAGMAAGQVNAGAGDDAVYLWRESYGGADSSNVQIHLGVGNDHVDTEGYGAGYYFSGTATITTGMGSDIVELSLRGLERGLDLLVITDFSVGAGGDKLDLTPVLARLHELGYDYSNPFTHSWLRFVQSGADTLLQVDKDSLGTGEDWQTLSILKNVVAADIDWGINLIPSLSLQGVVINADDADNIIDENNPFNALQVGDGSDFVQGNGGDDLLSGAFGGNDTLVGGVGQDQLFGFSGDDLLYGDTQDGSALGDSDLIAGGSGNDTIYGGDGDDRYGGVTYKGTSYSNGLLGEEGDDYIDGGDGKDRLDGGSGNDTLIGGTDDDTIYGGSGTDQLYGEAGDDYLSSNDGNDSLYGGSGKDSLNAYGNNHYLDGGEDIDSLYLSGNQSTLRGGIGADSLSVDGDNNLLDGGEGDNSFEVYGNANTIVGGDGIDVIHLAEMTAGQVDEGAGDDAVYLWRQYRGGVGSSSLQVNLGVGNDYVDTEGYSSGTATITTGMGSDIVELSLRGLESGLDPLVITDFSVGAGGDKLDLTPVLARLQEIGWDGVANPFDAGYLRVSTDGADAVLESRIANDSLFHALAVLKNTTSSSLTEANFVPALTLMASANQLPVVQANKTLSVFEDTLNQPLSITAPNDPDGGNIEIRVKQVPYSGVINLADGTPLTVDTALTAQQLSQLSFTPYENYFDTENSSQSYFSYTVTDDEGSVSTQSIALNVNSVNDAPVVYVNPDYVPVIKVGEAAVQIGSSNIYSLSDVDNQILVSARIVITNYAIGDTLAVDTTNTPISASFNTTLGVLTLSGNADVINVFASFTKLSHE